VLTVILLICLLFTYVCFFTFEFLVSLFICKFTFKFEFTFIFVIL
jgi:hypothetical protein